MRLSRRSRFWLASLLILVLGLGAHHLRLDARALLWLEESRRTSEERAASLWLPGYRTVLQVGVTGYEKEEFSDLAYNPATGTLFTVSSKQPLLIELSREGGVLRRIPVRGASDLEGVAVLEGGCMAITDERQHRLSIFRIDPGTQELRAEHFIQQVDLGHAEEPNKGFEGLAWDPRHRRLLLGKEKYPVMLYGLPSDGCRVTGELQELQDLGGYMTDLAALTVDPRSGYILALSQESHLLVELNETYQPHSFITLLRGLNGLEHSIPQAEGLALDEAGNLYVVSEHNLFYVFRKAPVDP
ncbi:SdiA-regulated domain-containing protein [Accumulibacter sp.]|uniref:SdiA-regulated domain-containing protein n=1 Tax=Accumulibacter sp. TaxID=2053492 RepID=UPI002629BA5F|nr:SdiA-regulated domain-containing protein [Accumulibacter sp.]